MKRILLICGSLNQTTMMHQIAAQLSDFDCSFSPYYADGHLNWMARAGLLNNTILGGRHKRDTIHYLKSHGLHIDYRGSRKNYDLVLTGSDAIIQRNIRASRLMLIQEGMTEPEALMYHLVRFMHLPRWMANTSVTGLSNDYDIFCVASQGYKELFCAKGVIPEKIIVTGIPNFDDLANIRKSRFPYKDFVLVATTPFRETWRPENRVRFIRRCLEIANGRQLVFKLHPLENALRAIREINHHAPGAKVYWRGNINMMIQKAHTVITQQSSCTFVALALGKKVYSNIDNSELERLMPIQNQGESAARIARICKLLIDTPMAIIEQERRQRSQGRFWEQSKA